VAHPLGGPDLAQLPMAEKYAGSRHLGVLPTGCVQCREGAKLVLFVTGMCDKECYYCPVNREKMYRDVMFANERPIHPGKWDDLFDECNLIDAKGAGITGGDPMVKPERVVEVVAALKARFGAQFHIHLYTSCAFDLAWLGRLKSAGLDEIRFHPEVDDYANMPASWHAPAIREARRVGLATTIEIPCIPGKELEILALAKYAEQAGCGGLNLNELEFSEPNVANLKARGFTVADDEGSRVAGSRETGLAVLDGWKAHATTRGIMRATSGTSAFAVHFCASAYKDAVQLMQRFRRRAGNVQRPFEEQTEEGTLVYGVLQPQDAASLGPLAERLRDEFEVPVAWVAVVAGRIETAPWVAEELASEPGLLATLGCSAWLSEVHPTADRLEVERTPLPEQGPGSSAA
jgi:pyruvate formate-lyase activating enzyme-like uncharacterized protein